MQAPLKKIRGDYRWKGVLALLDVKWLRLCVPFMVLHG